MEEPSPSNDSKTDGSWWPSPLLHVRDAAPWAESDIVVAEILSFNDGRHTGHRQVFAALVPIGTLEELKKNLAKLGHEVHGSGPRPFASRNRAYTPKFWMATEGVPRRSYEPLVLSWTSHDKTVVQLDPGFLMTYGLTPRSLGNGETRWDDPAAPRCDVAKVSAPSIWGFPVRTAASVAIQKDYLQDYLSLRQTALVQAYWEMRWGEADEEIQEKLGSKEAVEIKLSDRHFLLRRSWDDKNVVAVQVWGARIIAVPRSLPISEDELEKNGLVWPGFKGPITDDKAMQLSGDLVYIKDTVLGSYEGRPEFRVNPNSGSVTFGTQWGVGFCDRVGRDLISAELKKLYEGVPPHVTREWHSYAVDPPTKTALQRMVTERNIGVRAKEIVFATVGLGQALSRLAHEVSLRGLNSEDFVGLRQSALEYHGWWTFEKIDPVARHIPLNMREGVFLERCMALQQLIIEGLSQSNLRRILHQLGIPAGQIERLGSLKLLDRLVSLAQVAYQSGLELVLQGKEVWDRLKEDGTTPAEPIAHLFALYDLRTLGGHTSDNRRGKLEAHLTRFGVVAGDTAAGYGKILDRVYDTIGSEVQQVRGTIEAALSVCNPLVSKLPEGSSPNVPQTTEILSNQSKRQKGRRGRRGGRRNKLAKADSAGKKTEVKPESKKIEHENYIAPKGEWPLKDSLMIVHPVPRPRKPKR